MHAFLKTGKLTSSDKGGSSATKQPLKRKPNAPWVEKYRPETIDDIADQQEVVQVLKECLSGGDLPHLLFYGPPGTGKTSAILAAARQLFGDLVKERVLELNASDERGIQVIRDKVKVFSQMTVSSTRPDGRSCPPFKLVILDEADSMTNAAQSALRRTIERETRSTRFCLICNYVSRIIPPITSRCSKFRFKPLSQETILVRLKDICEREGVNNVDEEALQMSVNACGGDLRKAVISLQCCHRLFDAISAEGVVEVSGLIPEELVKGFININEYTALESFIEKFLLEAYSASQLLEQLSSVVVTSQCLSNLQKSVISEKIAVCGRRLLDGGTEAMQLNDLGCTVILANQQITAH